MSRGVETAALIDPWIYTTLSSDPQLSGLVGDHVYGPIVPEELNELYVTFSPNSVRDVITTGGYRIQVDALYLVKTVMQTSSKDESADAFARIDELLTVVLAETSNGSLTCTRETLLDQFQVIEGVPFLHLGGIFRIRGSLTST